MIYLVVGVGFLSLLIWAGRRPARRSDRHRLARGIAAAMAAVGAVVAGLRGAWVASAALVVVSAFIGGTVRARRDPPRDTGLMSEAQARSILGVGPSASRDEIDRAYRRLMLRVHPDVGGAPGLASHLNQARDLLLR